MRITKFIFLCAILAFNAISCTSGIDTDPSVFDFNNQNKNNNKPVFPVDLTGLSALDLITTKYDQFDLNCKMWTQKGLGLNKNVSPNDEFTWKVLEIYNQSAQLVLQSVLTNYQVDVEIAIDEIFHLANHSLKTKDQTQYNLAHTPEVTLSYSYSGKTFKGNQVTIDSAHQGRLPLLEKVNYQVVKQSHTSADDNNVKYITEVDCMIVSRIKSPFQNQFEVVE